MRPRHAAAKAREPPAQAAAEGVKPLADRLVAQPARVVFDRHVIDHIILHVVSVHPGHGATPSVQPSPAANLTCPARTHILPLRRSVMRPMQIRQPC
uniref:Uncharacterized protein n=1 Tax=Cereibacter sphaeroides (strain ATCC 17025 / ATH 2.4.3) TaxID=349102 RepID=A4WRR9_CERS5